MRRRQYALNVPRQVGIFDQPRAIPVQVLVPQVLADRVSDVEGAPRRRFIAYSPWGEPAVRQGITPLTVGYQWVRPQFG